jgi:hypothetical protein
MAAAQVTTREVSMWLRKICKDEGSNPDGCMSMYLAENGLFAVQGDQLDAETFGNLENVLPGEGAVFIKPEIVVEAVQRYRQGLP